MVPLHISKVTQRRFILGKQGLYPGRRWQGKAGVCEALRAGCVVQIDPLSIEVSPPFITALARAFKRFMQFVEAEQLDSAALSPIHLRETVEQSLHAL